MSEWISVEDRLPDDGQKVFYYFEPVDVHAGRFSQYVENGYKHALFGGAGGFLTDDVTHWQPRESGQPLPEPPE